MVATVGVARSLRDDVTRSKYAGPDCGPQHKRWFVPQRIAVVRAARGLSRSRLATGVNEHGDGGAGPTIDFSYDAVLVELIETGRIPAAPEFVFAAACVLGVEPSAFSECHDCMSVWVAGGAA